MSPIEIRRLDGSFEALGSAELSALRAQIQCGVLTPDTPGWHEAIFAWNGMAAESPAVVVQPMSADVVSRVVTLARERGFLVTIRGRGHNIAGTALAAHALTIDMARMRSVEVEPDRRRVHVGPGCTLGDVDEATAQHGLATVLGFVSETGVAGLTLGGGWGYLTRRFGWTVDNLQQVEMVTADGKVRVVDADTEPDLFWAVRGGGGNFGVVTRFTFRLHEVGPMVTGGLVAWSAEHIDEVLAAYQEITSNAPRELTLATVVRRASPAPFMPQKWHGRPVVAIVACYSGDDPERALAPVRAIGKPLTSTIQPIPYVRLQSMLNAMEPRGLHRYWKTEFLPGASGELLAAFREGGLGVTSPLSQSVLFHLGGALNARAADDGAVGNRDAHYIAGFSGTWFPGTPAEPHMAWARESWERIRPFSTGGNYVNFQLATDDVGRTEAAYGDNYERLRKIKAAYDPGNLFRINRNIPPAESEADEA